MKPAADTRAGFEERNAGLRPRGEEPIGAISAGHAAASDDDVVRREVVLSHDDIGTYRTAPGASANLARGLPVRRPDRAARRRSWRRPQRGWFPAPPPSALRRRRL